MESRPIIDEPTVVRMLSDFGDDGLDIFDQLVAIFLADTELLVKELKQAVASHDFEAAARKAHRIKGGSGQIGAVTLRAESEAAESSAQRQDAAALHASVARIETHWPQVVSELAALNNRFRSSGWHSCDSDEGFPNGVV